MSNPLRIRRLTLADLPFADHVRALAGWNQTPRDWERFLATEPEGCFLGEWDGTQAGTATTTVYGSTLAWIGMVLVHPSFRRRGVGRALLGRCIEFLHDRGVRCIKLDATPAGQLVYQELGFEVEWSLARWTGSPRPVSHTPSRCSVRAWEPRDMAALLRLDSEGFGVARRELLDALTSQSLAVHLAEGTGNALEGFGLLRPGSRAHYLGPVIASSEEAGLEVVESLLAGNDGHEVYWDIPDQNSKVIRWAERQGMTRQRPLTRMFLGRNTAPGDVRRQIALSGPETG